MFLYRKISEYLEKTKYIKYFSKFMEIYLIAEDLLNLNGMF